MKWIKSIRSLRHTNWQPYQAKAKQVAKRHPIWAAAFVLFAVLACYWLLLASDRYVSTAHIVVQRTDLSTGATVDGLASLIGGASGANRPDQLMMRDYLLSVGLLKKLDEKLDLRGHYSHWRRDPISKFLFTNAPVEWLHSYYLSRVSVELNDYDGVLAINVQAYTLKWPRQSATCWYLRERPSSTAWPTAWRKRRLIS